MLKIIQNLPKIFRGNEKIFRPLSGVAKVTPVPENEQKSPQKPTYKRIYQSKEVIQLSIVSKMKLYTGAIAISAFPMGYTVQAIMPEIEGAPLLAFLMGTTSTALISLYSLAVSKLIGVVHVCPKEENVKIGYLNFMGFRQNIDAKIKDVYWTGDTNFGTCHKIRIKNSNETLKLLKKYGEVYDYYLYDEVFAKTKPK